MKKNELNKKFLLLLTVGILLLVSVPLFLTYGDAYLQKDTPTERTVSLLENGIDTSKSLFSTGENRGFEEEIALSVAEFEEGKTLTAEKAVELARILHDVKDYEKALVMYELALDLEADDFLVRVHRGDIYRAIGQPEQAAEEYELAKIKFPSLYEIYIGQANAYKDIPGTPQYLVDDIYRAGIAEIPGQYELYEAFVDWLNRTDRESETIQYLEVMNLINPQPLLDQQIEDLKNKYPNS